MRSPDSWRTLDRWPGTDGQAAGPDGVRRRPATAIRPIDQTIVATIRPTPDQPIADWPTTVPPVPTGPPEPPEPPTSVADVWPSSMKMTNRVSGETAVASVATAVTACVPAASEVVGVQLQRPFAPVTATHSTPVSFDTVTVVPASEVPAKAGLPVLRTCPDVGAVTVGAASCVGVDVGVDVGTSVGVDVGVDVGTSVGVDVGVDVGTSVGEDVGTSVGEDVGTSVGEDVGTSVGEDVG